MRINIRPSPISPSDGGTGSHGHEADVLVIGSGFGGAVAAARLAQAGYAVTVLERGRRWRAGEFPRKPNLRDGWLWRVDRGLYDIRWLVGMIAVQASGWGGGSLAYANVFARPFDTALSRHWPAHLRRTELDPYYDLAAHMLEVAPTPHDPQTGQAPVRTGIIESLMGRTDRSKATIRPNLAVTFDNPEVWRPNIHGVPRRGCAFVGECVIGCNHGAKNSLDVTYLAVAEQHGARAETDIDVIGIEREDGGYIVTTRDLAAPGTPTRTWHAPRVVVAAGSVATTELLLRARDVHKTLPELSPRLGAGFSGNGDFLTFAEFRQPGGDMTTGPTITTNTILDVPEGRRSVWFQVQDGAFPVVLHELFDAVVPGQLVRRWWRRRFGEPDIRRVFAVLAMGHDSGAGRLRLNRSGRIVLAWRNRWQRSLYRSQRRLGPLLTRTLHTRSYNPLTWSLLRRTTTVHPLGGVPFGVDRTHGVIDEFGEVHGYPGLFVMDGSTLPASTGVNPSATILASAERSIQELIRRDGHPGWQAPEWHAVTRMPIPEDAGYAFAAELREATRGDGVQFSERMVTARSASTSITVQLEVQTRSIDGLVEDPAHTLSIRGTIDAVGIAESADIDGSLSLFPESGDVAMRYQLSFAGADEREWMLHGHKTIARRTPTGLWRGLTRLRAVVHPVDDDTAAIEATLHVHLRDVTRLLGSVRGSGFTRSRRIRSVLRFAVLFLRGALRRPSTRKDIT